MAPTKGWHGLLFQWSKDIQFWLYITLSLQLFRLVLIGVFHGQATSLSLGDLLAVTGNGLRYDISTAAMWALPTFLLSISCAFRPWNDRVQKVRLAVAAVYAVLAVLVFGTDLVYYDEYGDQFNQHLFGLVDDDTRAIFITIWKEYHPLVFLAAVLPAIGLNIWLVRRWLSYTPGYVHRAGIQVRNLGKRVAIGFSLMLVLVAAARGGTLWGEPIRLKHAFVVDDLFLNHTVLNPFSALRYTFKTRLALERSGGLSAFWPDGDIASALQRVMADRNPAAAGVRDLDAAFATSAPGTPGNKPRHVFLILMESQSGWAVLPAYRGLGFSPRLAKLAEQGVYYPNFLPSTGGTIGSLDALLTGFPDAGLQINYEGNSLKPYPSSLAETFRRLGYKTRFFYGGFLSWQRVDSFTKSQGFDEIYGGGNMSAGAATNEWGVSDKALFDYVLSKVDDETPSFNFILTTSNHPPYDLDLDALGYPIKSLPAPLKATKAETLKVLGHLWYADQQAGAFVHNAEQRLTRPLFALTGDHTARLQIRFPGDNVFEQFGVPFILYGPEVLQGVTADTRKAGSHIDIPPTLYELCAPKNFRYYSFGESLLRKSSPSYGLGFGFIVGEDLIATESEKPMVYGLPGHPHPADHPELAGVVERFRALQALSWYRVRRGNQLP